MNTTPSTLDHDAGYTTDEIIYRHEQQARSARIRRWLLGTGAVAVAGAAVAVGLMATSSHGTPASHPATTVNTGSPAVPSRPSAPAANPAVPASPAQGAGIAAQ